MMKQLISYSQNFEDIILNRCFSDIHDGFYIDIGSFDPIIDSTTKFFYDKGWFGINVEPQLDLYNEFVSNRSRDININAMIDDRSSAGILYVPTEFPGWSTGCNESLNYLQENSIDFKKIQCKTLTLSELFNNFANEVVHFLKIDVEGMEEAILRSHNFATKRPYVIIVETVFYNGIRRQNNIRPFLKSVNYDFVLHDGLNDFFISYECSDLKEYFSTPPNIFDNFCLAREIKLQEKIQAISNIINSK